MRNTFILCTAVSVIASLTKMVLDSAFGEKVSKVIQILLDIFILTILLSAFLGFRHIVYVGTDTYTSLNFEMIENDTLQEIKKESERMLAEKICNAVEKEFAEKPTFCKAVINIESFELCELTVKFDISKAFLSGYDVKRFLKDNYNVDAEVVFN